jgi:hypothetical protein
MSSGFGLSLTGKGGLPPPHNNLKDLSTNRYQPGLLGDKKQTKKAVKFSPVVRLGNSTVFPKPLCVSQSSGRSCLS